jgi:hypothetical protein
MATVNLAGMGMRDLPTVLGDYARLSDYHRGIVDFVNAQRRPKAREAVAWYCVLRGLRIEHAFHVTEVWDYILGTWMQDFIARCLDARRADVIYKFDTEPDWEMLARLSGEDCDVPKWRKEGKRAERKVSERLRSAT